MTRATALLATATLLVASCSYDANLTRADGVVVEAEIVDHNAETATLVLEHPDGTRSEEPASGFTDVDHPGNVVATVGAVITGFGLASFGLGAWAISQESADQPDSPGSPFALMGAMMALSGIPMLIWGWVVWDDSVEHTDALAAPMSVAPIFLITDDAVVGGISVRY